MPYLSQITNLASLAAPVVSGLINRNATGDAVDAYGNAVDASVAQANQTQQSVSDLQKTTLDQQKTLLEPYVTEGAKAVQTLGAGINDGSLTQPFSYDYSKLADDPAYKFALDETQKQTNTQAAARGLYDSGGTMKQLQKNAVDLSNQYYGADYARTEATFRANQQQRLAALNQLTATGKDAATSESAALGANLNAGQQSQQYTSAQLQELETERANAIAGGDILKANAIGDTITKATNTLGAITQIGKAAKAGQTMGGTAPYVREAIQLPGETASDASNLPPTDGNMVTNAAGAVGKAVETAATSALHGVEAAGHWMVSNPETIVVGVGILAVTAWLKSQAHWEANTQVKDFQEPFDTSMRKLQDGVQQSGGQMDPQQYQQVRQTAQTALQKYLQVLDQRYREKGTESDQGKVTAQAYQTFLKNYGPNGEGYLRQLDQFAGVA